MRGRPGGRAGRQAGRQAGRRAWQRWAQHARSAGRAPLPPTQPPSLPPSLLLSATRIPHAASAAASAHQPACQNNSLVKHQSVCVGQRQLSAALRGHARRRPHIHQVVPCSRQAAAIIGNISRSRQERVSGRGASGHRGRCAGHPTTRAGQPTKLCTTRQLWAAPQMPERDSAPAAIHPFQWQRHSKPPHPTHTQPQPGTAPARKRNSASMT